MARKITDDEKKMLLDLRVEDLTFSKFVELLGSRMTKKDGKVTRTKAKFNSEDTMILKKGEYFVDKDMETTVGRFLFNKFVIEKNLSKVIGYVNQHINGKNLGALDESMAQALLSDKITVDVMTTYLDRVQWLGMKLHTIICGSYTMGILRPEKKAMEARDRLIKENKKKLDEGDLIAMVKVEQDSLKVAEAIVEKDPGMDLFRSGARGSIGNNYKNISLMKGPVFNPTTGKFDLVTTNLMEGIAKKDIPIYGNAIVSGAYPKAVGTAVAGYFSKQLIAAFQAVVAGPPGSDCGTTLTIKHVIPAKTKGEYMYRYVVEGNKLVLLDPDTIDKYVNKPINLRSPSTCKGKEICSKCLGEMYYMLGIKNVGLTASRAASTILNLNMKKFHDATAKTQKVEPHELFM